MIFESIAYIAVITVAYALVSKRLAASPITGPMFFTTAGLLGASFGAWDPLFEAGGSVSLVLELILGLVLFTEAMKLRLISWTEDFALATRLLLIGLPLTILLGSLVGAVIFPAAGLLGGAIIATVLAPTDAALGLAVVENPTVPDRIREALSVESGLNDGIALPVLLFFTALAATEEGASFYRLFVEGVGVAIAVGALVGLAAGLTVKDASRRGWMQGRWQEIMVPIVAALALIVADTLGGSGFIAAFVAGLVFGHFARSMGPDVADFADDLAAVLTMLAFLLFGGVILAERLSDFTVATVTYAALSLTVVRMLPVAFAMAGTGLRRPTVAFMGWFGPRGLASIIFAAVVVEDLGIAQGDFVVATMVVTVTASIYLHGLTAYPGAERYGAWYESTRPPL